MSTKSTPQRGRKMSARGIALGTYGMGKCALKGQKHCASVLLPLRGGPSCCVTNPGRCPGLTSLCPFGAMSADINDRYQYPGRMLTMQPRQPAERRSSGGLPCLLSCGDAPCGVRRGDYHSSSQMFLPDVFSSFVRISPGLVIS